MLQHKFNGNRFCAIAIRNNIFLPDCHLRIDNTKDNPYVQATHDILSRCLREFLNCKLNIYYQDLHRLHSSQMERMHKSWPTMNAMVWHEPTSKIDKQIEKLVRDCFCIGWKFRLAIVVDTSRKTCRCSKRCLPYLWYVSPIQLVFHPVKLILNFWSHCPSA